MSRLEGVGLHSGGPCALTLTRSVGPTRLAVLDIEATLEELRIVRADHGVRVALGDGGPEVDLVEHVLAAVGALGLAEGVRLTIEGGEVPLLDGGAGDFSRALRALEARPRPPRARIVRAFATNVDGSRYAFEPGDGVAVEVTIEFDHPALGRSDARWDGDAEDFAHRIAPARTFGFLRDHAALVARGRARAVDLRAVVVFDETATTTGALAGRDEPARHKLLDLLGDLTLFGGPPRGRVLAERPGHARTHVALRRALAEGALVVDPPAPR